MFAHARKLVIGILVLCTTVRGMKGPDKNSADTVSTTATSRVTPGAGGTPGNNTAGERGDLTITVTHSQDDAPPKPGSPVTSAMVLPPLEPTVNRHDEPTSRQDGDVISHIRTPTGQSSETEHSGMPSNVSASEEALKGKGEYQDPPALTKLLDGAYYSTLKLVAGTGITAISTGFAFDRMREALDDIKHGTDATGAKTADPMAWGYVFAILLSVLGLFLISQVVFKDHANLHMKVAGMTLMTLSGVTGSLGVILLTTMGANGTLALGIFWGITGVLLILAFGARFFKDAKIKMDFSVIGHVVGAICLITGSGMMADRIRESVQDFEGIQDGYLVFMFVLGAVGLVWISHLLNPFDKKEGVVKNIFQPALIPALTSVLAAGLFTLGAKNAAENSATAGLTFWVIAAFVAGGICLIVPIALGINKGCLKARPMVPALKK